MLVPILELGPAKPRAVQDTPTAQVRRRNLMVH